MAIIAEPAVARKNLILGAGLFWLAGGLILIIRAGMLDLRFEFNHILLALLAIAVGYVKQRWVFRRVVAANIRRIRQLSPHKEKICLFAFQSIESYLLVTVMVIAGILLRQTGLDHQVLSLIYLAVGTALTLSSQYYLGQSRLN